MVAQVKRLNWAMHVLERALGAVALVAILAVPSPATSHGADPRSANAARTAPNILGCITGRDASPLAAVSVVVNVEGARWNTATDSAGCYRVELPSRGPFTVTASFRPRH